MQPTDRKTNAPRNNGLLETSSPPVPTDRQRVETEVRESDRQLHTLIDNLPGMVFSATGDRTRTLSFVSEGCLELTGRTAAELTGPPPRGLIDLIHPDDQERVMTTVQWAVAEDQPYEVEYRLAHADGSERTILERGAVRRTAAGELRIDGVALDSTARGNVDRQRAASHEQLLTILDSIEASICVSDLASCKILFVNRKMREEFGDQAAGQPCYRVFQHRESPCEFCPASRLLDEQGEPGPVCQWEHHNPVTDRWYSNYDHAVRWIDGRMVRLQVAFDNTGRRESEDKLRQVQKMEVIGLLAGGVAHDFNNILSVILGYAAMALVDIGDTNPRVRRDLDQIQQAGLRARDLVRQILSFCHHSAERFQPLKPQRIVREVIKMLRSSFPATIAVTPRITAAEGTVLADPSQLHQVLMNLCTNALHAMKDGGELTIGLARTVLADGPLRHELRQLEPGPYLRLWVRDTGSGIPAEIRDRIFDPFFTTKGEGEGTGLGLAVVQSIVAAHHGAVSVHSRPGEGTEVSVYLPELVVDEAAAEAEEDGQLPVGTESILIIDDEPSVVLVLQRFLETLGYTVETFTESPRAFETYARDVHAWDLVLTDMTMPGFTGLAISRAMLALRPDQPIIICTGYSESIDEDRARAEGIRELLAKPVGLDTLARAVRRALDSGPPPAAA